MSQTENNIISSMNDDKYYIQSKNKENKKDTSFSNTNKYPVLIQKGDNNYKYLVKNKIASEEKKEDNSRKKSIKKNPNIEINELNVDKDLESQTKRYLKDSNEIIVNDIKEDIDISEIREKLDSEYDKNEINSNKEEGNETNTNTSINPGICTIILRTILYNFIRPIYLYLLIVCILLCLPDYSDLPVIVSMIIYLVIILTSIIIEIVEEKNGRNNHIFNDEITEYGKISDNKVINLIGKNIQKNDIIILKRDTVCPCDMILVDSSVNSLPLFFQTDSLTGNFNFRSRLIKNNFISKFSELKNEFEEIFVDFIQNMEKEELKKWLDEQNKIKQSKLIYKDFLERNGLINEIEEQKRKEGEAQRKINELKFDPFSKIYEELRYQEYFKYLSEHLIKGYYYTPKNSSNSNIYIEIQTPEDNPEIFEINQKNMCFCGEKVKNADWLIGIVVNVGENVKPLKQINKEFTSLSYYFDKRKKIFESEIDAYFYILLTILFVLGILAGLINMFYVTNIDGIYNREDKNRHPKSPVKNFYHSMLEYIILMHNIIPYPIFFILEIVLLFQKMYINKDIDIINKNQQILTDSKLIEDLGKIDLILTDKTGTLTKNERFFRYCVIADGCYEYVDNDEFKDKKSALKSLPKNYEKPLSFHDYDMINSSSFEKGNGIIDSVQYDGFVVRSVQNFNECIYLDRTEKLIEEFWKAIALCHDAVPVFNKNNLVTDYYLNEETKYDKKYFSNSGDNTTLVEMASRQGFTFFMDEKNSGIYMGDGTPTRENNKFFNFKTINCEIILGSPGPDTQKLSLPINKLCHLKFHSQRKRESVIVKDGNYIKLYIKGPMDEILPRVDESYTPKKVINTTKNWLNIVENTGCRAFVVGMRILTEDEYKVFFDCFFEAHSDEIDTKLRINKVIDSLESHLTLLGGAFIEDYLPEKIEEAISNIKDAGIKIWTLTGDKVSNSYNVGLATGIINKDNEIIIAEVNQEALLEKQNEEKNYKSNLNQRIKEYMNKGKDKKESDEEKNKKEMQKKLEEKIESVLKSFNLEFKRMQKNYPLVNFANKFDIVIDSISFREISKSEKNIKNFFDRAILANSLTFCEFNSNDKRLLVKNFRNYIKGIKGIQSYTMMGVGDGFNDIEFLKEVDIGVGLNNGINKYTKINLDNFYDISRLIMFHGMNNLKRNSDIFEILLIRHFIFGFIFFIYGFHCFFSNVYIIPTGDILISLFVLNLFGPFLKGIFDLNVYYFYDKKEKVPKKEEIEIKNDTNSENSSKSSNYEKKKKKENVDKNNEYLQEIKEKEERKKAKMLKTIYDRAFKYIYLEKNNDMIESGSEHIPYKKYTHISKFILLILKSILFSLINFYISYGSLEAGHNIIDLKGNMIDFRRFQITLWTNYCFIIFLENVIFTYYYTIYRLVEIILFVLIYLIIYFLYQKNDTDTSNPFNSFLLFLNFFLIVLVCSFVNFWIYIVRNLFDNGVNYKLRYMKILDRYLLEMKEMVDYNDEEEENDEEENEEMLETKNNKMRKTKNDEKYKLLEIINEESKLSDNNNKDIDFGKSNNDFNFGNNYFKEMNTMNNYMENPDNNANKIIINRKNKNYYDSQRSFRGSNNNSILNDQKFAEYFNKNLIDKKEIKNAQFQESMNLMKDNINKKKEKNMNENLKHVKEKK